MNTISTTIEINGAVLKVENGKVYARAFGTTAFNRSMHWSWIEIKVDDLKREVRRELEEAGLIC